MYTHTVEGFPGSSAGKESACNAGDPRSIPGLGRSPGEGIGCPLQYSWTSLVAQTVKNLPAMKETWFQSLDWENPWWRAWQPTPVFLPGKFHWQRSLASYSPWGCRVRHDWVNSTQLSLLTISVHFCLFVIKICKEKLKDVSRIPMSESFTYFNYSWFCCFCKDGLVRDLSAHLE